MAYTFVERSPFSALVGTSIVGPKGADLREIPYLDPRAIDPFSQASPTPMEEGYPVDPAAVPNAIYFESKNKVLPDVIKCRGVDVVSKAVRDVVESLEEGLHQFLPVEVYRPKSQASISLHYWMVVCQRIDSPDERHTTYSRRPTGIWQRAGGGKFVFSRAAIGKSHLWRDPFIPGSVFCSQALGDALAAAQLSGLYLEPLEEV